MLVMKLWAEIDVNAVGHADADTVADVTEVTSVVEEELRLVVVLLVTAAVVEVTAAVVEVVVEAVPGTH